MRAITSWWSLKQWLGLHLRSDPSYTRYRQPISRLVDEVSRGRSCEKCMQDRRVRDQREG